jgi:DNA helicase II / ATP-dependent DNA helicase PcrA
LDTTQGKGEDELIVFTTIFRTKGLEFDYVVLPDCDDNLLPYLKGERLDIYDKQGIVQERVMSSKLESERRLFYLALTRARKGVLIGGTGNPSRFLAEIRVADTEVVTNAIQHLASGDTTARKTLLQSLRPNGIMPNLLNNLLSGYLPDMGEQSLAAQFREELGLFPPFEGGVPQTMPVF